MTPTTSIAAEAQQRDISAANALQAPLLKVLAAVSRAALLPDDDVRAAALRLGECAAAAATAYGRDNLWQRRSATAARKEADAAMLAALEDLITAASASLHPPALVRPPRWTWRRRTTAALPPGTDQVGRP